MKPAPMKSQRKKASEEGTANFLAWLIILALIFLGIYGLIKWVF